MAAAAAVLLVALVAEDPATMRNAPRPDAPAQATVWRGDWLEVRGESAGFLKVYDHRRERPGYIRPQVVRMYKLEPAVAPELAAVVRFLRDSAGNESLGIGAAALALKAAPAGTDTTELLASIGTMAERLAKRASATRRSDGKDATLAAHVEVAQSYGVKLTVMDGDPAWVDSGLTRVRPTQGGAGVESTGAKVKVCYDGEAWAAVLAAPSAAAVERARAALFFAADGCRPALASPAEERERNDQRIQALQAVDFAAEGALPASLLGRVRLRRAEAFAWRAFDEARRGNADAASRAEGTAVRELALCDRGLLAPEDLDDYEAAAIKVGASRWALETPAKRPEARSPTIEFAPRAPGETCVRVVDGTGTRAHVAGERCSYGVVWQSALRWSPSGTAATIAVQPLAAWTELWVIRRNSDGAWAFETLTPATADPDSTSGTVESAGFSPDGARLLVVREAHAGGHLTRRFQVLAASTLAVEKWAGSADKLLAFKRWSAPSWRAGTLALR